MIRVKGISKQISRKQILDDVYLEVPKGSIFGLIGINGAGKTTLIRHIIGAYRADSGYVEIEGQRVYENAETKAKLVYIPDEFPMTFGNNIEEIHKLYRDIYPSFNEARYQTLLNSLQLSNLDDFSTFSKGMKKQVLFVLALSIQPQYLIMDEPFDGLDPQIRKAIWDILIADVSERHMTILISSHHLKELDNMCDHIALIHEGKIVFEDSLDKIKDKYQKIQVVLPNSKDMYEIEKQLVIHDHSYIGKIHTLIVEGDKTMIQHCIDKYQPIINQTIPLHLEEIFLFTIGGNRDVVKQIMD